MRKTRTKIVNPLSPAEKFFIEKSYELLGEETIDTYRLRLHNPRTILSELSYLIKSFHDKNIAEDYPKAVCSEAVDLLNLDKELRFNQINKNYFLSLLGKKELLKLYYSINIILEENKNYLNDLIDAIDLEINRLNGLANLYIAEYKTLNRLTSFLYVELRKNGFNRHYLHRTIRALFSSSKGGNTFNDRFNALKLVSKKKLEKFTIYVLFETSHGKSYLDRNPIKLRFEKKSRLLQTANSLNNPNFVEFINEVTGEYIYSIEVIAVDYYSATIEARKIIQKSLDFCFLGSDQESIALSANCFVLGSIDPSKSRKQNLNYKLDGELKGSYYTYDRFVKKLSLVSSKNVDQNALEKLTSGLRYLRLGSEAQFAEHRLINYWIAIEYIFSSSDGGGNKTARLKEFFKKIHAYSYARKLFVDLHDSIQNFQVHTSLTKYDNTDITYLLDSVTETELLHFSSQYPLLNYRLHILKERFGTGIAISNELRRHMNNIERNILRIYRVRNQIVHNAMSEIIADDIFELAAHLKYYLVFIINGLLDFLLDHPVDADNKKGIGIDDYFTVLSLKIEGILFQDKATIDELIKINSPVEYLK